MCVADDCVTCVVGDGCSVKVKESRVRTSWRWRGNAAAGAVLDRSVAARVRRAGADVSVRPCLCTAVPAAAQ